MRTPLLRRLALRVRLVCIAVVVLGGLLPPFQQEGSAALPEEVAADIPQVLLVEDGFLMKSSSLTQQGARRAYAEGIIHVVEEGENLEKIARKYGIKRDTILWANHIDPGQGIHPGQELVILPVDGVLHTVSRGQSLSRISELYGVSADEIRAQNKLESDFILVGQELIIPGAQPILAKTQNVAVHPPKAPSTQPSPGTKPPPVAPPVVLTSGVFQMPCNSCFFTQYFNPGHYAVDIQTKGGGPIFAAEDGEVIRADYGWNGGYGNVIEVDHGNDVVTLYAHNKELYVKKGDTVKRGQMISWMGNTGRVYGATGIHLHFEVRVKGVKKNPLLYLQ